MADRRRPALSLLVIAALAAATAATAGIIRSSGTVRAELTFEKKGFEYRALTVSITRSGAQWRSGNLGTAYVERPTLSVRDLDGDGEPEVWVDTYTGGAHCCFETRFFHYLPARRAYAKTARNWGDVGYRAINLDGRDGVELMSSDDRFAYAFTYFAASAFPYQVWHLDEGRLLDVTRSFPGEIALDANQLWAAYRKLRVTHDDVRGVLAAWMAEQYLLGREQQGWRALDAAERRGDLTGDSVWPQGRAYLRALRAFLHKLGYAR